MDERDGGLLAWQWRHYPDNHTERGNLILHLVTFPLGWIGFLCLALSPVVSGWLAFGLVLPAIAIALQGRGHKLEKVAPIPFRGPGDAVARLLVEQTVTLPRFILSGAWGRAFRSANPSAS